MRSEALLCRKILALARKEPELFLFKIHGSPFQMAGLPDLVGNFRDKVLYIELKTGNHNMSRIQEVVAHKILKTGAKVHVVRSVEQFIDLIKELKSSYK